MSNDKEVDRSRYLYSKTVKGKPYLYFRMADGALVPLPLDQGSPEFRRAYDDCLRTRQKLAAKAPKLPERKSIETANVRFIGDTVGRGIEVYKESADYNSKKPTTKKKYNRWLGTLNEKLGTTRLRDLDVNAVDIYSDMIATEMSPSNARFQVAMISNVWDVCRKHKEFGLAKLTNPTLGAESRYKVKTPHQPWSDDLQDKFMQFAPERLKLAKLLLHFSAQRGGDCVRMQIRDFDGQGLWVRPEKTSDGTDLAPNYHLCPEPLREALEKRFLESNSPEQFILLNERGRQWASANSLSCSIRDFMVKVGLRQKGSKDQPMRGPSMHGLRKNAASEVAALLVGTQGIKSVTGHKSDDQAAYYAKHAAQVALNRQVVERWNEAIAQKRQERVGRRRAKVHRVK
jgi:integrase